MLRRWVAQVLVHCSHGKDRTGLTVGLLLALCGASVEVCCGGGGWWPVRDASPWGRWRDSLVAAAGMQDICRDYHLSEAHGNTEEGREKFRKVRPGVVREEGRHASL